LNVVEYDAWVDNIKFSCYFERCVRYSDEMYSSTSEHKVLAMTDSLLTGSMNLLIGLEEDYLRMVLNNVLRVRTT
jgi:hypothetical protein